jgi:hypothetical protein
MKIETILDKITEQVELLNGQPLEDFSGDTLSRLAVRLAAYKAGLGSHSTIAKRDTWQAEKCFKLAKAQAVIDLKSEGYNSTDAKELAITRATETYDILIEAQALEDRITTISINVHDLIDAIKSRVINVQMERSESNAR